MKKIKILILIILSSFMLNSCAAVATAFVVTYLGGTALAYTCATTPGLCDGPEETPEQKEKREKKEKAKEEERKIKKKNYIHSVILRKKKNVTIFENISISMPDKLNFKKVKEPLELDFGNVISILHDGQKEFPQMLYLAKRTNKNFEEIIKNGRDISYEMYSKKQGQEYIENSIKEYEESIKKYPFEGYYQKKLQEFKDKKDKNYEIMTDIEKIGNNAYIITEKINYFGKNITEITYVKILKDGVYIIGRGDAKDIFEGIFKN